MAKEIHKMKINMNKMKTTCHLGLKMCKLCLDNLRKLRPFQH